MQNVRNPKCSFQYNRRRTTDERRNAITKDPVKLIRVKKINNPFSARNLRDEENKKAGLRSIYDHDGMLRKETSFFGRTYFNSVHYSINNKFCTKYELPSTIIHLSTHLLHTEVTKHLIWHTSLIFHNPIYQQKLYVRN